MKALEVQNDTAATVVLKVRRSIFAPEHLPKVSSLTADITVMSINVAGTNAIGDYLVSEIQNSRILFGESPTTGLPNSGSVAPLGPAPAGASPAQLPTHTQLVQDLAAAQLSNVQTLFAMPQASTPLSDAGSLPAGAGQTPLQVETVAIQSSLISQQFANTSTLFRTLGLGSNFSGSA